MTERSAERSVAGWRHWDTAAFCTGATPLLMLALFYTGVAPGTFNTALLVVSLLIYPFAAFFAWRQGDGRLAAAGALLLLLAALTASSMILLLVACLMGNCI